MLRKFIRFFLGTKLGGYILEQARLAFKTDGVFVETPEIVPVNARRSETPDASLRINILIPSVNRKDVYGGIATALAFFYQLVETMQVRSRIIIVDTLFDFKNSVAAPDYTIVSHDDPDIHGKQLLNFIDRIGKTFPVTEGDVFMATGWWTAYCAPDILKWQSEQYGNPQKPLIYFIQDFEPGFYPWSTKFLLAESTYKDDCKKIAVYNSGWLHEFFKQEDLHFEHEFCFEPTLNKTLLAQLKKGRAAAKKKKRVIIYGRPSVARNAFELLIYSLKKWCLQREDIDEWEILSLGEDHKDYKLERGKKVISMGKVSLEQYAEIMLETYMAVSLMVSPHPSYPPLEMAAFGIKVITNKYANKDLSTFSGNIISLDVCNETSISGALESLAASFTETAVFDAPDSYLSETDSGFTDICKDVAGILEKSGASC